MLVGEDIKKCVGFLLVDQQDIDSHCIVRRPVATAFFVIVPHDDARFCYVVTARHVVEASRRCGPLYVRINLKAGGFEDFTTHQDHWACHPATDIAVLRFDMPFNGLQTLDIKFISLSMLLTDEAVVQRRIGVGDDLFFVSLFSKHPGEKRNQPILRFGNISLMPEEPIAVKMYPDSEDSSLKIDAYLVEARSWGGYSGSPVFVYYPHHRELNRLPFKGSGPELLGLIHGHHNIEQEIESLGDIGSARVPINAGIAVVVPAQKIIDVLMEEEFMKERKRVVDQRKKKQVPATDVDIVTTPLTKKDFERLLKKAAQPVKKRGSRAS